MASRLGPVSTAGLLVLLLVSASSLWIQSADGQAYDYGFDVTEHRHHLSRRLLRPQNDTVPYIVGTLAMPNASSGTPARQEIRQLEKDADMWTLYLLGLNMMQYTDQADLLSYYQIAGIHGVPWVEWNGVAATPGNEKTGYCTHASVLFLTWHRPYLALYEQVLYSLIQYIASLYPDDATRSRYEAAAANFRIPYMDWAAAPPAGESVLPNSVGASAVINITGPNGDQLIANPLYTYLFKPLNATMFIEDPYDTWLTTVRAPTANNSAAGSNNTKVAMALNKNFESFQLRLYNLFSKYDQYGNFSNEAWIPTSAAGNYDSLESLHDTIHSLAGLQGHMAWIPFSAFDPIFFLHHCMVDRVLALWQILYPDSWIEPTVATSNSFTTSTGQILDGQTPLTPFYASSNGTFWTSDGVRDPRMLGYTYDDMVDFPQSSLLVANATAQEQAKALINRLYGASSPAVLGVFSGGDARTRKQMADMRRRWTGRRVANVSVEKRSSPSPSPSSSLPGASTLAALPRCVLDDNGRYREWAVNIQAAKQALQSTFFVHVFLGARPADSAEWAYADSLVGTVSVFAAPASAVGDMDMRRSRVSGVVPLTAALARLVGRGELASLAPEDVTPYLRTHLQYGIRTADGATMAAPKDVAGLGIAVVSAVVQAPAKLADLPRWGDEEVQYTLI